MISFVLVLRSDSEHKISGVVLVVNFADSLLPLTVAFVFLQLILGEPGCQIGFHDLVTRDSTSGLFRVGICGL